MRCLRDLRACLDLKGLVTGRRCWQRSLPIETEPCEGCGAKAFLAAECSARCLEALRAAHPYAALGLSLAEAVAAGAGKKAVEAKPWTVGYRHVVLRVSCETGL